MSLARASFRGQIGRTLGSGLLLAINQTAGVLVPVAAGMAVDLAVAEGDLAALAHWSGVITLLLVAVVLAGSFGSWLNFSSEVTTSHRLLVRIVQRVLARPDAGSETGVLAMRDSRQLAHVCRLFGLAGPALCTVVVGFAALVPTSPWLAAIVAAGALLTILLSRVLSRLLSSKLEIERDGLLDAGLLATDLLDGLRVLQGLEAVGAAKDGYRQVSDRSARRRVAALRWESVHTASTLVVANGMLVAVAWTGGAAALAGTATIGEIVVAVGLTNTVTVALSTLATLGPPLARAATAHRHLAQLPPISEHDPGIRPSGGRGELLFSDVPLGSDSNFARSSTRGSGTRISREVRQGARFGVEGGSCTGIVSATPEDLDELRAVLSRERPYRGRIRLDGVELTDLAPRTVLVSRQEADLFAGTVWDNINAVSSRRGPHISSVIHAAAVDEFVDALPEGLDTRVTERGRSLSGGQRQRIALARALAADPEVLVLEEPLSALDAVTESRVARDLRSLRRGRTTVLLSASPALLHVCDRVIFLNEGVMRDSGLHTDLSGDPAYAEAVLT